MKILDLSKEKRNDLMILVTIWSIIFAPYIFKGELIRDDLGLLTLPLKFSNYLDFQWKMSSLSIMSARPISAIFHGVSYWLFGTNAWAFHLVNLVIFGASILYFYLAIEKLVSRDIALLSALFALVYPCASATVFSSIMVNSNLAGIFWSSALYYTEVHNKRKIFLTSLLLLLSALSYEAFIPLFVLNMLAGAFVPRFEKNEKRNLLMSVLPVFIALMGFGFYRVYLEDVLFDPPFSRISISPLNTAIYKFRESLVMGVKIALSHSIRISVRAVDNLGLMPVYSLGIILIVLIVIGYYLYKSGIFQKSDGSTGSQYFLELINRTTILSISGFPHFDIFILSLLLFVCAHSIFVFSTYSPDSSGFENRTLGAIRFVTALCFSIIGVISWRVFLNKRIKTAIAGALIAVFCLHLLSMIGQREAWISASHYNEKIIANINEMISNKGLHDLDTMRLVAKIPFDFPGQVNREPIISVPWDITPLLALANPTIEIEANVYNPTTVVSQDKITIDGYWEAEFPFYLYDHDRNILTTITSEQEWENALTETSSE